MSRPLAAALMLPLIAAAGLPHAQGVCSDVYTVIRGDTLYSIARLCRSSVAAIAAASRVDDPRRIETGQVLVIPGGVPAMAPPAIRPAPPAARTGGGPDDVEDPARGPMGM